MKIILILLVLLLCACSEISDEEKSLVGYWEWEVIDDKFEESGFLDLREDRSYSYKIESKNPTERIVQEKQNYSQLWRLHNNSVCTATNWEGATIFNEAKVIEEVCFWDVQKTGQGEIYLTVNAGLSYGEINAARKKN